MVSHFLSRSARAGKRATAGGSLDSHGACASHHSCLQPIAPLHFGSPLCSQTCFCVSCGLREVSGCGGLCWLLPWYIWGQALPRDTELAARPGRSWWWGMKVNNFVIGWLGALFQEEARRWNCLQCSWWKEGFSAWPRALQAEGLAVLEGEHFPSSSPPFPESLANTH